MDQALSFLFFLLNHVSIYIEIFLWVKVYILENRRNCMGVGSDVMSMNDFMMQSRNSFNRYEN